MIFETLKHKLRDALFPPTEHARRVREWKAGGNEIRRYQYDLNEDSVVFDMGGYEGNFTSDIFSLYSCSVHIFEPLRQYHEKIQERFKKNSRIYPWNFGLSKKTEQLEIAVKDDGTSLFDDTGSTREVVKMVRAADFFAEHTIRHIDLMKINIEGGEYDLLEHLIDEKLVGRIQNIQIQFHDFVPDAEARMKKIQEALCDTHHLTYNYPFVWENWQINNLV